MKDYTKLSASEKEALVKKASESAYNYEKTYGSCAQSCLGGLRDAFPDLGVTDEMFKTSYGLAGGCGFCLEGTCGALSGAAMAISILNGRDKDHMDDDFSACYDKIKKVIANFRSKYGVTCREVQTAMLGDCYDFFTEEGEAGYNAKDGDENCAKAVGYSTKLVAEMIVNGEL